MKHTFYLDYGAGKVLIEPKSRQLKLAWIREFNDFIMRKKLSGSFILTESQATAAFTHFITNGNETALIYIYEYGTYLTGTLIYEGNAKILGEFDFYANTITFNSFDTIDIYTAIAEYFKVKTKFINPFDGVSNAVIQFTVEGKAGLCNELQAYIWTGTKYEAAGNAYAIPILGRVCGCSSATNIVIYDNYYRAIKQFIFNGTDFTADTDGTILQLSENTGNGALMSYTSGKILFVDDYYNTLQTYEEATGTWTLLGDEPTPELLYPSLCELGSGYAAMVDENTKMLRAISLSSDQPLFNGYPIEIGEVSKPKICQIDVTTNTIALIDDNTLALRVFRYDNVTKEWAQIGNTYILDTIANATITSSATNVIELCDPYSQTLQKYTFDGTDWTKTGTETIAGGGYSTMCEYIGTYLVVANSDSYRYRSARNIRFYGIQGCINAATSDISGQYINTVFLYSVKPVNGATFDIDKVFIGNMGQLVGASRDLGDAQYIEYTLQDLFKLCELFQNYFYIVEGSSSDFDIMFTQPNLFSSFGTDIDVSAYLPTNNKRIYGENFNISKEEIVFKNEFNSDFKGQVIEYERQNSSLLTEPYNFTTDLGELVKNSIGQNTEFEKSGHMLVYLEENGSGYLHFAYSPSATGISLTENVKNYKLSKTQIFNDFWKDYRYKNDGTIKINGVDVAVHDTIRDIIQFPSIDIKIDSFPVLPASLDWGSGIKSFITELTYDFSTNITTIESRLLDL